MTASAQITLWAAGIGAALVAMLGGTGQWNGWSWIGGSFWAIGTLGALEWERQKRRRP